VISGFFVSVCDGAIVVRPMWFENLAKMSRGSSIQIMRDCWIRVIVPNKKDRNSIRLNGSNVPIGMSATIFDSWRVSIEEHVLYARNVCLSKNQREIHDIERSISLQGLRKIDDVKMAYGSWLGSIVMVLPAISTGKNAVVEDNPAANRGIPDYCLAVRSPAKGSGRHHSERRCWEKGEQR
jgi:acetyltransferase-like isoleucine patch superfamily enzyme